MKERITRMNRSLFELETGILIFGIAGQLILFFFAGRGLYSAAWWIGIATAAVCAVDMWWALDRGLDLGRQGAAKKIMVHYMIRYVMIAIVLVIVALTDTLNPLITFAGVMGLKIGAYLNFFAKKVSTWIYGEEILPDLVEIPEEEIDVQTESIDTTHKRILPDKRKVHQSRITVHSLSTPPNEIQTYRCET